MESDPLPTILKGAPLRLQRIHVAIDRPGFMAAPTPCALMEVFGRIASAAGKVAEARSPLQMAGCQTLGFTPSLKLAAVDGRRPGAGKVSASGQGLAATTRTLAGATTATLTPRLTRATRNPLARGRDIRVTVRIAFTPKGTNKAEIIKKPLTIHRRR